MGNVHSEKAADLCILNKSRTNKIIIYAINFQILDNANMVTNANINILLLIKIANRNNRNNTINNNKYVHIF